MPNFSTGDSSWIIQRKILQSLNDLQNSLSNLDLSLQNYNNVVVNVANTIAEALVDPATGAEVSMAFEHHEIHEGDSYHYSNIQALNSATYKWLLTAPATTKWVHMLISAVGTVEFSLSLYENPTTPSGGAVATPHTRNRNYNTPAGLAVTAGVSTVSDGALVSTIRSGQGRSSSEIRGLDEWVLKQNTRYIVNLTTFGNGYGTLFLNWYEHINLA